MTQLVEGQPARLDIGESLPCRIIGFSGPEVVLALEMPPEEEIERGRHAYLLLESEGQLQAVRGRVTTPSAEEVVLRDVSAGGVCVGREGADPGAGSLELTITVASHEVVAVGRIMRVTGTEVGVQFEQIEDADRLLLASLALAYHRPR